MEVNDGSAPAETVDSLADFLEGEDTEEVEAVDESDAAAEPESETDDTPEDEAAAESDELPAGHYKVLVKDANGAIVEQKVSFDELKQGYQRGLEVTAVRQEAEKQVTHVREQATREVSGYREQSMRTINELDGLVSQALAIVTPEQLMSLATTDRDAYNEAFQRQQMLSQVRERIRAVKESEGKAAQQQALQEQHRHVAAIREKSLAELAKAGITTAAVQKLYDEAGPQYGFSHEELSTIVDHRFVLLLKDAAAHRKLEKSRPDVAKKVREAPKLPPARNQSSQPIPDALRKRLQSKHVKSADLAALLERNF